MSLTHYTTMAQRNAGTSEHYEAVTPSDSTNLGYIARALYIGGDGDVVAVRKDGTAVTFSGMIAGSYLLGECIRVNSTNTTATNIVAMY